MRQLSIVIVNYHSTQSLKTCLAALSGTNVDSDIEVFVVNNDSAQELASVSHPPKPWIHWIHNRSNLGFAAAANIGFRASSWDFVLVLNPDILVLAQALETLLDSLKLHADAAIALPRLNNPDGSLQYSCRRFYDFTTLMMRRAPFNKIVPDHPTVRDHLMLDWDHQSLAEVDWGLGAAMLVRRAAIPGADLFDERFFLYFEDVDLCLRTRRQGWKVLYNPEAIFVHQHQRESGQTWNFAAKRHHFVSLLKFLWKHQGQLRTEPRPEKEKSSALQSPRN
jgi:N-acetylglucosaminyl-diphospho-decaprenol L-rhamnosyltransferase